MVCVVSSRCLDELKWINFSSSFTFISFCLALAMKDEIVLRKMLYCRLPSICLLWSHSVNGRYGWVANSPASFSWVLVTDSPEVSLSFLWAPPGKCSWLRHYATSRSVAVSIPVEVIGFFNCTNSFRRTMALGSIQPLTEVSTKNIPGGKGRPVGRSAGA
jgi:hypothetical protein